MATTKTNKRWNGVLVGRVLVTNDAPIPRQCIVRLGGAVVLHQTMGAGSTAELVNDRGSLWALASGKAITVRWRAVRT